MPDFGALFYVVRLVAYGVSASQTSFTKKEEEKSPPFEKGGLGGIFNSMTKSAYKMMAGFSCKAGWIG
jgi:hypothetical protein